MKSSVGYRRVSSADQNPARQLEGLQLDRVFTDYASGGTKDRPQLNEMIAYVREGDTLYVHSMDRLARNLEHLKEIVDVFKTKKVAVCFKKEGLCFDGSESPMSTLLFHMMGAFAEFERSFIRERQAQGIAIAKAKGVYKTGPRYPLEKLAEMDRLLEIGVSKAKIERSLGMKKGIVYYYLRKRRISANDPR